jgi:maltose O-acetyltransferase
MAAGASIDADFAWAIEIGAHTVIANSVQIIAHDAAIKRLTGYTEVRPVKIGERCYLGAGAMVLPGAVIGDEAVIGAGAIVRGEVPAGSVAVGNPAKVIASADELREKHLERMDRQGVFELRPRDLGSAELAEVGQALAERQHIYVL